MSAIDAVFEDRKAYVAYLTAGDGGFDQSLEIMQTYADNGVDIIEVGVPFSDPLADGPVIQAAASRAIQDGFRLQDVLRLIQKFKSSYETAVVLFSYYNPILQFGTLDEMMQAAEDAGVDGCLIVDLPIEEASAYHDACLNHHLDPIYLLSPSTPLERIEKIAKLGHGMLYYACRKGVTGARDAFPDDMVAKLQEIKSVTELPVAVGFGIANKTMAANVLAHADGFVVGSKFVNMAHEDMNQLSDVVNSLDPR